ncbi:hypothetical protein NLJ89_g9333 [Agrocybe chaxingu]|uniref:Uncharacterized protein n=1 Tax=Agrocybe chaxingu TaxID=84603 RepID=A0A9W8JTH6_9AGAR|nr:hypothetical protein NLJ89_g9333 [Agrocybe chaxingu]
MKPIAPNLRLSPSRAVADGVFLLSSAHGVPAESEDFSDTDPVTTFNIPAPYIARSPMRQAPASPSRNAYLLLGAAAARLACLQVTFARSNALAASTSSIPATIARPTQTPHRPTSVVSPVVRPSTGRLQHTGTRPQAEASTSSAIRPKQIPAVLSPELEEHVFEDMPVPFEFTPGRLENPICILSRSATPHEIPAPAPQIDGAANSNQPARAYATVAVQTDPVYVLSRFSTPEPLPFRATNLSHAGTPETDSSSDTPSSRRRSREQFENDNEDEDERPSFRRRIEEIFASMESPPPSPPGRSSARTRIRPKGKKRSYLTERPDEFGPAYLVKVLDSSDDEYQSWPSFPQAPSSDASGSGQATTPFIPDLSTPHIDNNDGADSDDYPDLFNFDDPATIAALDQVLKDMEDAPEQEEPMIVGKGKAVAR